MSIFLKITKSVIDNIPYPGTAQALYRDPVLRGFGLRVEIAQKSFFVEKRIGGEGTLKRELGIESNAGIR